MRYYIDDSDNYIGGTDGAPLSQNEVSFAPNDARQKWNGVSYDPVLQSALDAQADNEVEDGLVTGKSIAKAIALTFFDEINILRVEAGLSERTLNQLKNAVKAKLLTNLKIQ